MRFIETQTLSEKQKYEIIGLWNKEYPQKIAYSALAEFDQYLDGLLDKHYIILADEEETLKGWMVYFIRDQERWFAMIMDSSMQGKGLGSQFLDLAKKNNTVLNGWVIDYDRELKQNGEYYKSPIGFYKKNDFQVLTDIRLEFKEMSGVKVKWERPKNPQ